MYNKTPLPFCTLVLSFLCAGRLFRNSGPGLSAGVRGAVVYLLATLVVAQGGTQDFQATWSTSSGTKTADYRIYCPSAADVPRIKGVVFLYPGSGGDWRFRANDTVWQEAARSLGCALVGAGSNAGYMSMTESESRASFDAILAVAALAGGRPEIVNAPALFAGFSLGGFVSTEMANHVHDRVIACVPQRGSSVLSASQPASARGVPILFMPGSEDSNGLTCPSVTDTIFEGWRDQGGLSAYAMDWRAPHDTFVNQGWSLAWIWMAQCLALRVPSGVLPSLDVGNPVPLQTLALASGWLGQRPYATSATGDDTSTHVLIAPYASYTGDVSLASWLPNEAVARAYQAQTSFDGVSTRTEIPLQGPLAIVGAAQPKTEIQPGQTNPPQLAVLPVGEAFDITVDPRGFGNAAVTLAPQNLIANGDFSQWTSGLPDGWSSGNAAGLSQGPDLGTAGGSAVIRDTASLSQAFTPVATNFQFRLTFTVNLTPTNTAWNQPLIVSLYQVNQATNSAAPWLTFRFTASNVSMGPFLSNVYTNNSSSVALSSAAVTGSSYDFQAGTVPSGPVKYEFILNYFAGKNAYAVSYGPLGGPLFNTGTLALFRNPTNPAFQGVQNIQFYSYLNGAALDDVRLSVIAAMTQPILSMAYYDDAQLLAVQNAAGTNGWRLPYTLATRGIHGLTVVATDGLGTQSSAYRAVVAAQAVTQGITHYRFERSPGFKTDQYDILNLTSNATTGTGPQQVALSASGAGSAFPQCFAGIGGTNGYAARFQVAKGDVFTCADSPLLPSGTTPFTVEAFVNLASSGAGGLFRTITAHGTGSTGSTLSWQFIATGEGSGQGARRLVLQVCADNAAGTLDTLNSGFELQTNVDYYVAAVFVPTNTSASGLTFYVKDLTAGGALQMSSRTHTQTSLTNASSAFAVGNRNDRGNGWDGVIDEVRLTTRALSVGELLVNSVAVPTVPGKISPEDSRIAYSDYVRRTFVTAPFDAAVTLARFDRLLPIASKGYEWDNPRTRACFRTDATNAHVSLYYNDLHISTSARNSRGFYRIDGQTNAAWTFQTVATTTVRTQEQVVVSLAVPMGGGFHDYEVVLPYGDSVDFQGVQVNADAQFQTPPARPSTRYVAYGDSITHGFTASEVGKSYAYRVAEIKDWQLVNMGYGGRSATATDGTTVASQQANVISVLIGVNDWQGGVPLTTFSNRLDGFLTNLRTQQPAVPIYLLTPLWVDAAWNPGTQIAPLEDYRQVVRAVAAARNDPKIVVIEGPDLIDHSTVYFDSVLVHPNDLGFDMMSARLAALMEMASPGTVKTWLGGTAANWSDAETWTPSGVPLAANAVSVSNSATATLTIQSGVAAVAASLTFDNASGKDATLAIADGGSFTVAGAITQAGSGQATVSNINLAATVSLVNVMPADAETWLTFNTVGGAGGLVKDGAGVLRLTGEVAYGGATVVSNGTLDFAGSGTTTLTNAVTGFGLFRKSGTGTLVVNAATNGINTFSGAVVVDGGTLVQSLGTTQRRGFSSAASFTVNSNALIITARDAMNDGASHRLNGGTLKAGGGFQCLGPLTLNGGSLVTGPGSGGPYQTFALNANVVVTGAAPSVIRAESGTYNGVHLAYNSAAGVRRTFRVEEVTGRADADLTVTASLLDSSHTGNSAGLIKTGAGTMVLSGGTNTYSGATVVSNGAFLVSSGGMSNSAVTVVSGAAFGTADATVSRVAALTLDEGARFVWRYDGDAHAAGRIDVTGMLTLPATATLDIAGSGLLSSKQVVMAAGALAGVTDLRTWTITGAPAGSCLTVDGNTVVLFVSRGTQMHVR